MGGDCAGAWAAEGFPSSTEWASWPQFTEALNAGLGVFRAHVEHVAKLGDSDTLTFGLPQVGLYSAACRQIFNLVVEESTARRCENATCGRVFVHQLGGAKYRQHRS